MFSPHDGVNAWALPLGDMQACALGYRRSDHPDQGFKMCGHCTLHIGRNGGEGT